MNNENDFDREEITHRNVRAVVKWFNATKGFGFVQLNEGAPDAFLHISVVERYGNRELYEGAAIVCDLMQGRKGLQVAEIYSVEGGTAPAGGGHGSGHGGGHGGGYSGGQAGGHGSHGGGATEVIEGTVKFFNAEKGFGFVIPDNGGKDVFVSGRTLERVGLTALQPNQRVRLHTRQGQKGPMAEQVELL
ncbi:MAG: cold-shock protein [Kiloniellaceae bacterium]